MVIDVLDQPRLYLGMTETSRVTYRSCFIFFSMRMFCQVYYWNDGMECHLRLGGKGRLTLVSKCLPEIASTEGTIWMASMCEREQQIGEGANQGFGRGE